MPTSAEILIASPKIMQSIFAAFTDFITYRLATKTYGHQSAAAQATLFLTVASPWQAFCSVRTLSNSIETTLTTLALYYWPWDWFTSVSEPSNDRPAQKHSTSTSKVDNDASQDLYRSLVAAALACILRPTNIIVWATVSISLLVRFGTISKLLTLAQAAVLAGGAVLAVSVSADRVFYDAWVLPPWRFLQFNLVQSLAVFYGKNRPDYYLTEGLPLLLTTALPFAAVGLWQGLISTSNVSEAGHVTEKTIRSTLATASISTVLAFSLISHKEMRFIYPLLPMLLVLAAKPFADFFAPFARPSKTSKRALLFLMVCVNITIGWYTLFVHQRGVIDVLHYLRREHEDKVPTTYGFAPPKTGSDITTVGFLMPCHSTPWRSHLVYSDIHAWALTCEPPLNLTLAQREAYMDEADVFYEDPTAWIASNSTLR